MDGSINPFLRATLAAFGSLVGVVAGFALDRRVDNRKERQALVQQLGSIQEELSSNKSAANGNYKVIADLQAGSADTDHYALSVCDSSAWEATVGNQLAEEIDSELYSNLQRIYARSNTLNEQIRRLRTEQLHPQIEGEKTDEFGVDIWTISVRYWNESTESVQTTGLADLIQEKCNELKMDIEELEPELEQEIQELRSDKTTTASIPRWWSPLY